MHPNSRMVDVHFSGSNTDQPSDPERQSQQLKSWHRSEPDHRTANNPNNGNADANTKCANRPFPMFLHLLSADCSKSIQESDQEKQTENSYGSCTCYSAKQEWDGEQ